VHCLLFYDVVADFADRRKAPRADHLALAHQVVDRGELLFRGDSPAIAEAFANADPHVTNGLVTRPLPVRR
jgi:hypothetical protein